MHIHTIPLNIEKLLGGTAHMDATEFGAYMSLMICAYQKKNKLPNNDSRLARMARCSPKVWARVRPIIAEKFTISSEFWEHMGVLQQLEKMNYLSTKNKTNALKRYETNLPVADVSQCQTPANTSIKYQESNIKEKIIKKEKPKGVSPPIDVRDGVWSDFLKLRKEKKAPVTETVVSRIRGEAEKIGWSLERALIEMCARGWQGFNSQWIINEKQKGKSNESLDDVAARVLAKHGIELEEIPDRSHGQAMLCDARHLREI
jgi:uncharacterized protein YdaU (DUF1376 family)